MIVEQGQCIIDIVLQHAGDISALFDLANENGLSITDDVEPGTELKIVDVIEPGLVNYYAARSYVPAAGISLADEAAQPGGIGYMQIGVDFKIS